MPHQSRLSHQPQQFLGFDHIDVRVWSLRVVEGFYDILMPELGLTRKTTAIVDTEGEWHEASADDPYNAIEFHEPIRPDRAGFFIGFIEDSAMQPGSRTRIAIRVGSPEDLERWYKFLKSIGAVNVEKSGDMENYPAIFFEDTSGTKLELVARGPGT